MTNDQVKFIHSLLEQGKESWVDAANAILYISEIPGQVAHYAEAKIIVRAFLQRLLDHDDYLLAATLLWGNVRLNTLTQYTQDVFRAMHENNMLLIQGGASTSKCLGPDVPVMMHDGSTKKAKDVVVGDVLMGDDSNPRNVLSTTKGRSKMYRINPERGELWRCNDEHILTMRVNQDGKWVALDIPIKEYLEYPAWRKAELKQFSVGVEFPEQPVSEDPYVYGVRVGNNETGGKRIPESYMKNSRENRLKLWAGLLDSGGCIGKMKDRFLFTTERESIAYQIVWLAKSLGFYATFTGAGFQICINCSEGGSNVGIKVEDIGEGKYCGFSVDGNSRFLLGDFTVTHNSYSMGAWLLLDWIRDPYFTSVKIVSKDEKHLKGNLFGHIYSLFQGMAIPLTDNDAEEVVWREHDMFLGLKAVGNIAGLQGEALKHSSSSSGDLKGYKPQPRRKTPHPKFGNMSRLRVAVDEAQSAPVGIFQDFMSVRGSLDGLDLVKIICAYNPTSLSDRVVNEAEPLHGWIETDLDSLYEWKSKKGWRVLRLDGARSENVVAKSKIFSGIQTYEGFISFLQGDGADSSPDYFTFGRGWPPLKGSANTIIPATWCVEARGEAVWLEKPIMGASVDLAFQGSDTAQMTIFKWGLAKGWRRADGKYVEYVDRTSAGRKKPRHVLEVHQIIQMEKSYDSIQMSEEITGRCQMLGISPDWTVVDKSGSGLGTFSHLTKYWGNIMGIMWGDGATDMLVLAEDQEAASSRFQGIMSEMWFAFREWLNPTVGAIIINPMVPTSPLNVQLSSRRFRYAKNGTMKVESKDEYRQRNQRSCDEADSVIQIVQLIRARGHILPGMMEQSDSRFSNQESERAGLETADADESLAKDGGGVEYLDRN